MSLSRGPLVVRTLPVVALLLLYAVAASAVAERSPVQAALEDAAAQRVGPPQADQASPAALGAGAAPEVGNTPAAPAVAAPPPAAEESGPEAQRGQDSLFSPAYQSCMDDAAGVTTAMQTCMETEQTRLERYVAILRQRLMQALPQERAAALGKALEAWESLRQNGSVAMYAPEGGSLSPLMASLWYLEQTARTARWLEGLTENLDK